MASDPTRESGVPESAARDGVPESAARGGVPETTALGSVPGGPNRPGASPLAAVAIAVGIVVVGVLIVVATFLADGVITAFKQVGASETMPSASDVPSADPYAPAPGEAVFGSSSVSDAFFTPTQSAGFGRPGRATIIHSTTGEASAELTQLWATRAADPKDTTCRFAASSVPVFGDEKSNSAPEVVASDPGVADLATASTVNQSARVFANAAEASAYIARLQRAATGCTSIDVGELHGSVSPDEAGTITPHASWIVDGTFAGTTGRLYVVDMRHDNMVMRTEVFVAAADAGAVSDSVIDGIQDRAEQSLIDIKP